jgi:hypothetical protein
MFELRVRGHQGSIGAGRRALLGWTGRLGAVMAGGAIAGVTDIGTWTGLALADEDREHDSIEGSWIASVTAVDPPLGTMDSLMTFVPGGGVVESRRLYVPASPFGAVLQTGGHGSWRAAERRSFDVSFMFLLQGGPGNAAANGGPLGTDRIRWKATLTGDNELRGPFRSEVRDAGGTLILAVRGTIRATRIVVEPL